MEGEIWEGIRAVGLKVAERFSDGACVSSRVLFSVPAESENRTLGSFLSILRSSEDPTISLSKVWRSVFPSHRRSLFSPTQTNRQRAFETPSLFGGVHATGRPPPPNSPGHRGPETPLLGRPMPHRVESIPRERTGPSRLSVR